MTVIARNGLGRLAGGRRDPAASGGAPVAASIRRRARPARAVGGLRRPGVVHRRRRAAGRSASATSRSRSSDVIAHAARPSDRGRRSSSSARCACRACSPAVGVGAAFGMSGAIFQSLTRNPLGSPDVIGFNSGAALGAVIVIVLRTAAPRPRSPSARSPVACSPRSSSTCCAWKHGRAGVSASCSSASASAYATRGVDRLPAHPGEDLRRPARRGWLTGSLNGRALGARPRRRSRRCWCSCPLALADAAARCDSLELGDDTAAALACASGRRELALVRRRRRPRRARRRRRRPDRVRGVRAPPIARRLVQLTGIACIVPAALVGALLVLVADLAGRRVMAPTELPVGIVDRGARRAVPALAADPRRPGRDTM